MITAGYDTVPGCAPGLRPLWVNGGPTHGLVFEEDPDSPHIELGDQATFTHKYTGDWETVKANIVSRGTNLVDSLGSVFRVVGCTAEHQKGNKGRLTIQMEAVFYVPPDEFSDDIAEFNPYLAKHPRYYNQLSPKDLANIQHAVEDTQELSRMEAANLAAQSNNPALFTELLQKLQRGEETYYLSGSHLVWKSYYGTAQIKEEGGFLEDPTYVIPPQFIFNQIVVDATVQTRSILPVGWQWLRLADTQMFNRTWFQITRTWLGGPAGHWDPDIYQRI